jgi:hypothetical protein
MSILLNVFLGDGLRSGVSPLAVNKYIISYTWYKYNVDDCDMLSLSVQRRCNIFFQLQRVQGLNWNVNYMFCLWFYILWNVMSFTLKEEHGLRSSGHKMEEVTGGGRKSRNGEICDLCATGQTLLGWPNEGGWDEREGYWRETCSACTDFVGKLKGKKQLWRTRQTRQDNSETK